MGYSFLLVIAPLLYCDVRPEVFVEDEVDLIEINHLYNDDGSLILDQIIYYKMKPTYVFEDGNRVGGYGFEVVDWRSIPKSLARETLSGKELIDKRNAFIQEWKKKYPKSIPPPFTPSFNGGSYVPRKEYSTGDYYQIFFDTEYSQSSSFLPRKIKAKAVIETWTQYDPELEARELVPDDRRIKLSKPSKHYEQ